MTPNKNYNVFHISKVREETIVREFQFYLKMGLFSDCEKLLDCGCGAGYLIGVCKANGIMAYGVDVDKDIIDNKKILKCDLNKERISFKDNFFDVVHSHSNIEHLSDQFHFMAEVKRVLKRNGLLIVITSNWSNDGEKTRFWYDSTHTKPYTHESLRKLFNMFGFKILYIQPKFAGHTALWKLPSFLKWRLGSHMFVVGRNIK